MKNKKTKTKLKQNKVVGSVNEAIDKDQRLHAKMERLQRTRDLILNVIDKHYSNKIDRVLRKIEFNELQMKQAKEYTLKKLGRK